MQYDLLGYVDFLYLLRRLWTSAPCDRSVAVSQMSLDAQMLQNLPTILADRICICVLYVEKYMNA